MTIKLNDLRDNKGARQTRKRKGRGIGSGLGKTAGRGHKGQKSRSGVAIKGFEGGQMPIYRRLPKRGFTNIFRKAWAVVNLGSLQSAIDAKKIDASKTITSELMQAAGLARTGLPLRLLAKGKLELVAKNIVIEVEASSKSALEAVVANGGKVNLMPFAGARAARQGKKDEKKTELAKLDETKSGETKPEEKINWRKVKKEKAKKEIAEKVARGECKIKYTKTRYKKTKDRKAKYKKLEAKQAPAPAQ